MDMLDALIKRLDGTNVSALAKEAGIARKTVVRIRNRDNTPNLSTVAKLIAALDRMAPKRKAPKPAAISAKRTVKES